jgi:thioredoxin reductase (NADPH)
VTLAHRRTTFRAHERTVAQVRGSSTRVLAPFQVERVHGNGSLSAVDLVSCDGDLRERVEVQAVVAALGFTADLGPLTRWGLELRKRRILVDSTMRTNLPRVFAAGDVADYDGKVRLISVGFGEAATAVNNAAATIDPTARVAPGHSSDAAVSGAVGVPVNG